MNKTEQNIQIYIGNPQNKSFFHMFFFNNSKVHNTGTSDYYKEF